MCGIFGLAHDRSEALEPAFIQATADRLFKLSESRGKEAAGLAVQGEASIQVYKQPIPATRFLRDSEYRKLFPKSNGSSFPLTLIGHSRLVTNGSEEIHFNNQPVIAHGIAGIHNGIVVNDDELWRRFPTMQRHCQVDSEVIFSLIRRQLADGAALPEAVYQTFDQIYGQATIATFFDDRRQLLLYTNNGSLYIAVNERRTALVFASERHILSELLRRGDLVRRLGAFEISKVEPNSGWLVGLDDFELRALEPGAASKAPAPIAPALASNGQRAIVDVPPAGGRVEEAPAVAASPQRTPRDLEDAFTRCREAISHLRPCSRCLLPETMPFIAFDDEGVCSYCRHHRKIELKPRAELEEMVESLRRSGKRPDCLVGLSGGRDSTYALHYLKAELGLNPVAFTYDWGMVTELARRNISRICGKLGIEHILVSADIRKKRENIRKNVSAWLKKPDLGLIPLFMAGDKQYFHYANKLKQQLGVELTFLGENLLERTDFKTGYCGIPPRHNDEDRVYVLSLADQVRMQLYYGWQYLRNPAFLNSSIVDTLWAFASYYLIPRDYVNFYRYVEWNEQTVDRTIIEEYGWELAPDTTSTWRIGDGTAAFYNYVYYTVAGFSENETLRSHQIREGQITRQDAIARVEEENQPRYESIRWYCETAGISWVDALRTIQTIPKRYPL